MMVTFVTNLVTGKDDVLTFRASIWREQENYKRI